MAASQQHSGRSEPARALRRLSSVRLEMFSDGVFAIAVTLLAVQLRPPNLDGVTTVGGLMQALFEQRTQFGYYALNFVNVGGVWLEHHELLDPMETHGRRLARRNLWFLLTVSLLPYSVGVLEAHPGSGPAGGLLLLTMAFTRITFMLVCLGVRAELEPGQATEELVMPALLRSAAAVVLVALAAVAVSNPPSAGVVAGLLVVVYLLAARLLVRGWQHRYRRRLAARQAAGNTRGECPAPRRRAAPHGAAIRP
jgi:uncharacterized membrane protein